MPCGQNQSVPQPVLFSNSTPAAPAGSTQVQVQQDPNTGAFSFYVTLPRFADREVPAGAMDGTNAIFTLAHAPNPALSLELFRNGLQLDQSTDSGVTGDYTLAGATITLLLRNLPDSTAGEILRAWYRY